MRDGTVRRGFIGETICLAALVVLLFGWLEHACALTTSTATTAISGTDLDSLEKRLFSEDYPTQPTDERLARLEKMVFGSARTGSDGDRLTSLLLAVPNLTPSSSAAPEPNATPAGGNTEGNQNQNTANTTPALSEETPSDASVDYYPTITALEQQILGHTDRKARLSKRLNDLETKAFGKPESDGKDFATRVDRLKAYLASKNGGNEDYLTAPDSAIQARSNLPPEQLDVTSQITLLEKTVFAKTYKHDGVISRLDRLEKAVFPSKPLQTFSSVPTRVRRLMMSLDLPTTAQPTESNAASRFTASYGGPAERESNQQSGGTDKHHFWHKVGSVLGKVGTIAAESAMSSMSGGYGNGMYGNGMMMGPGFGGGMF